ncbi:MAG: virulence RhuM family protein [Oscillospiraceae bacterium]|nr:virulence RhuM family protein [Oscillospiraceae bacterium]
MGKGVFKHKKTETLPTASTAQYLTFLASVGDDKEAIEVRYEDENLWLTQKLMAEVYGVTVSAINQHIKTLFDDGEIDLSTIKKYLIVQKEGERQVSREVDHYSLQAIISIGFKIENQRAVEFRKWARNIVKDYTIQGWAMDVPKLKNGHKLTNEFFDRQLAIIREIRLSERKFYQKITDIYSTAVDYDITSKQTQDFFATVQNKLHFSIHGKTAAEVIVARADSNKENMGLETWEEAPHGKIQKPDVVIAKNYLTDSEIGQLERIVNAYLDLAEMQAEKRIPMTMEDWSKYLSEFLTLTKREILNGKGSISAEKAKEHAYTQFERYRIIQDKIYISDFDKFIELEREVKELNETQN